MMCNIMRDIKDIKFRAKPMSNHPSYPKWVVGLIQSIAKDGTGFLREEHKNCIHITLWVMMIILLLLNY